MAKDVSPEERFSENLRRMMDSRGLSCYQMEKESGISRQSLWNWQNGQTPVLSAVVRVAEFFGVTVDEMLS